MTLRTIHILRIENITRHSLASRIHQVHPLAERGLMETDCHQLVKIRTEDGEARGQENAISDPYHSSWLYLEGWFKQCRATDRHKTCVLTWPRHAKPLRVISGSPRPLQLLTAWSDAGATHYSSKSFTFPSHKWLMLFRRLFSVVWQLGDIFPPDVVLVLLFYCIILFGLIIKS